jgi:hypothetical protein
MDGRIMESDEWGEVAMMPYVFETSTANTKFFYQTVPRFQFSLLGYLADC